MFKTEDEIKNAIREYFIFDKLSEMRIDIFARSYLKHLKNMTKKEIGELTLENINQISIIRADPTFIKVYFENGSAFVYTRAGDFAALESRILYPRKLDTEKDQFISFVLEEMESLIRERANGSTSKIKSYIRIVESAAENAYHENKYISPTERIELAHRTIQTLKEASRWEKLVREYESL